MTRIDLNCDLGEGAGFDAELMPLISSANIACGAHAGDAAMMEASVALAQKYGVSVGAHPGFADREHFGRRELKLLPGEIETLVAEQIVALRAFGPIHHVKPHGALYNVAARDSRVAEAIASAVCAVDRSLIVYALGGGALVRAARELGLRVAEEVFADRTYQHDGSLTPRAQPGAMIEDEEKAAAQVVRMIREGRVTAVDGTEIPIMADTVSLHGDAPRSVAFARRLRQDLTRAGITIAPYKDLPLRRPADP